MIDIQKMITTKNCYVGKNKPKYIVIHETDNWAKGAGAKKHAQAMNNGNLEGTVHYYVDDKNIYQTLDHQNGAYAVGDNKNKVNNSLHGIHNLNSINIEICVNPDSDYNLAVKNTIDLTKSLMESEKIDIKNVVRHYDATRKNCPRKILATKGAWEDFKNKLIENNNTNEFKNGDYSGKKARATVDALRVRYDRGTNHKILTNVNKGQVFELEYCLNGWVSVKGYNGNKGLGYVSTHYLELI